jgi:long-chain acyl-CoA synthetase
MTSSDTATQPNPAQPDPAKPWPVLSVAEAHALLTAPGSVYEIEEREIGGIRMKMWKNAPPTLRDLFGAARLHGNKTFLVLEDERVTYEGFARAALALAEALMEAGVAKGDRVALLMRNLPEWPAAFFGAALVGAVIVPLNAWWTAPELEYGLKDCGAKVLIADAERLERLAAHLERCPTLSRIFVARTPDAPSQPLTRTLDSVIGTPSSWGALPDRPYPPVPLDPEDSATIFYTSGTTGNPKGALGSHRNLLYSLGAAGIMMARSYLRRGEPVPEPDPNAPQPAVLLAVPFFHVTGCQATMIPALAGGGKIVLIRKWDVETAMQLIERERVTGAGGVPTIAWQLIEHPARERYDLSSLTAVTYGGAPSAPELVRKIREVFPTAQAGSGWGMTETSSTVTGHFAEDYEARPESCGPASPVFELKIADAEGKSLPPGAIGELWVRGPGVVKGYWNKPEATAATFVDGWVRTGDIAKLDGEGFCFIVDRAKDMLIRGGENIYCVEVENALYAHSDVMDAALVGIPHRTLGEEPAAVVALRPGGSVTEAELRAFVATRIAAFKVPVRILFWPDTLPRNANGKILKTQLKQAFG